MAVTYTQELLDRAQAYAAQPVDSRRRAEGLAEIKALLAAITGEPVGNCRQCQYADYFARVRTYILQATRFLHPETVSKATYTLAPAFAGETFVHESYNKAVSADNLTDDDAEFFIKSGFRHAFLKDGKPLPEPKEAAEGDEAAKPAAKLRKADHQARYEELHGEKPADSLTVEQLIEANTAKEADLAAQRD